MKQLKFLILNATFDHHHNYHQYIGKLIPLIQEKNLYPFESKILHQVFYKT